MPEGGAPAVPPLSCPDVTFSGPGPDPAAQGAAPAAPPRHFLAFDFGTRRVGVAFGGTLLGRGRPLATLRETGDARFAAIERLLHEWQPDALVVGVPFHPDGAAHENTASARRFARRLRGRFRLPVHEEDERYTTTEALADGAHDADAAAAVLILEQHLRTRNAATPAEAAAEPPASTTAESARPPGPTR
jgi:putative Holliday junction resolvase